MPKRSFCASGGTWRLFYEFLQLDEIVTAECYSLQLNSLADEIKKPIYWTSRKVILLVWQDRMLLFELSKSFLT